MVEIKLIAEIILVVIAAALIIWYVVVNFQSINTAFYGWIDSIKNSLTSG
jgi:hypothetical protein